MSAKLTILAIGVFCPAMYCPCVTATCVVGQAVREVVVKILGNTQCSLLLVEKRVSGALCTCRVPL